MSIIANGPKLRIAPAGRVRLREAALVGCFDRQYPLRAGLRGADRCTSPVCAGQKPVAFYEVRTNEIPAAAPRADTPFLT
jgi:hypothetical protein